MSTACEARRVDLFREMVKPYPSELEQRFTLRDGTRVLIRPIRPSDRQIEMEFVQKLSNESRYFRFMGALRELSDAMLSRFTQIDYDREMALIAISCENDQETEVGVVRYVVSPDGTSCEFAIAIADAWQHRGLGSALMSGLIDAARTRGLQVMEGIVMSSNHKMLGLMTALGFDIESVPGDPTIRRVVKHLAGIRGPKPGSSGIAVADVN